MSCPSILLSCQNIFLTSLSCLGLSGCSGVICLLSTQPAWLRRYYSILAFLTFYIRRLGFFLLLRLVVSYILYRHASLFSFVCMYVSIYLLGLHPSQDCVCTRYKIPQTG
ncbi:hypothetical protein BJX68DRAFT_123125 [Aspergillus pseudodeflectus]|uniref:Uncharacterized protein n=1 Tax=Aspergillus pseudodeflectus TaxID=176178 RepID=A0ABR4K3E6_9EURO